MRCSSASWELSPWSCCAINQAVLFPWGCPAAVMPRVGSSSSWEKAATCGFSCSHVLGCLQGNCSTWICSSEESTGGCEVAGRQGAGGGKALTRLSTGDSAGEGRMCLPLTFEILMACELILSSAGLPVSKFLLISKYWERTWKMLIHLWFIAVSRLAS